MNEMDFGEVLCCTWFVSCGLEWEWKICTLGRLMGQTVWVLLPAGKHMLFYTPFTRSSKHQAGLV